MSNYSDSLKELGGKSNFFGQSGSDCLNSKKYILVVEDDFIVTEIISEALCKFFNCEVLTASSGYDALELFRIHADQTYCIILDYGIPDMHASRILKQLREMSALPKVILSSGYPESIVLNDFPTEMIDTFIPKPFSPMKLISIIENLFQTQIPITYQI